MLKRSYRAAAIIAALIFAGFGCRPVLDASVSQRTRAEQAKNAIWIKEQPTFSARLSPTGNGYFWVDLKARPETTVSVTLEGPGVVGSGEQSIVVGPDGVVHFEWPIGRPGLYRFKGSVEFINIVRAAFDGELEVENGTP